MRTIFFKAEFFFFPIANFVFILSDVKNLAAIGYEHTIYSIVINIQYTGSGPQKNKYQLILPLEKISFVLMS